MMDWIGDRPVRDLPGVYPGITAAAAAVQRRYPNCKMISWAPYGEGVLFELLGSAATSFDVAVLLAR